MSETFGLPWLEGGERKQIPVGGGGLPTSGLIGPWLASMFYQFFTQEELEGIKADDVVRRGEWNICYYLDYGEAEKAARAVAAVTDNRVNINTVWRLECPKNKIFWASEDAAEKWHGDYIKQEVNVKTMGSKVRHEYHFIALPSAVAAAARLAGNKGAEFDISELLDRNTDHDYPFQCEMIGATFMKGDRLSVKAERASAKEFEGLVQAARDAEAVDPIAAAAAQNSDIPYQCSLLWQRKAVLWELLGESDPLNDTYQLEKKTDTKSDNLGQYIDVAQVTWPKAMWAKVALVDDPREDAVFGEGMRNQIPVILEFYANEAAARAAWEAERPEGAESGQGEGYPALPATWEEMGETAESFKADFIKTFTRKPDITLKTACDLLMVDAAELAYYREKFGV